MKPQGVRRVCASAKKRSLLTLLLTVGIFSHFQKRKYLNCIQLRNGS